MSQGEIRSRRAACRFADGRQAYWPGNATKRGAGTVRARRLRPAIGAGPRPYVITPSPLLTLRPCGYGE